jgi:5-methylcytosine-specific restriction endonuclease McrA
MTWDTSPRHGTHWKPPGYAALRRRAFASWNDRCIDCSSTERLELDHLDGNRDNWNESNLGPRCHPCHAAKTAKEAAAARRARRRRPDEDHPGLRRG